MLEVIATYKAAYKALEPFAADLEEFGLTDDAMYKDYVAYKDGYDLARAEMLDYLGITVR